MARKKQIRHKNNQIVRPVANQKHKDTVFRMLFSDKKHLLSLYNAVNETNYQMYHYMNISLPLTQTFHSEIYFIFRVNTKN